MPPDTPSRRLPAGSLDDATDPRPEAPRLAPVTPAPRWSSERVRSVRPWTAWLLTIRTTRPAGFRYVPGLYARLGLGETDDSAVWRAFSMVSAPHEPDLEFVATRVDGGAFSARLAGLGPGDPIRIECAAYGFLTVTALAPGRDLWLLASGTGIGPFVSMLRDPKARASFERIVLLHGVRHAVELAYREEIEALAAGRPAGPAYEAVPQDAAARLVYLPVVTRESVPGALGERIPALLADGRLEAAAGAALGVAHARVMGCGNPELVAALRTLLRERGFSTGRRGLPGTMAFERYW